MEPNLNTNTIACRNCGNTFTGTYCNKCGEKKFSAHDKRIGHLVEEFLHFFTHFEGTLITSIKTMFTKPGKMSLDYSEGVRKKYYKPINLYLLLIVIYLLAPKLFPQGLNMPLENYRGQTITKKAIAYDKIIDRKLAKEGIPFDELSEKFHHASEKVAEPTLIVFLPLCAIGLMLLYFKKGTFYDHFIVSTEINSFIIILVFLLLPIIVKTAFYLFPQLASLPSNEDSISLFILFLIVAYTTIVLRRFYKSPYFISFVKSLLFVSFYIVAYLAYRFLLFTIIMSII